MSPSGSFPHQHRLRLGEAVHHGSRRVARRRRPPRAPRIAQTWRSYSKCSTVPESNVNVLFLLLQRIDASFTLDNYSCGQLGGPTDEVPLSVVCDQECVWLGRKHEAHVLSPVKFLISVTTFTVNASQMYLQGSFWSRATNHRELRKTNRIL